MNKGYVSSDIVEQCKRLDQAGISYSFFYLTSISGAGRGEEGERLTAEVCNQIHPKLVGANMLTIYPESELYQEIQKGTWKEEGEIEKYKELKTLVENLSIPTVFAALGASNAIQIQGQLPEDRAKLLNILDKIIENVNEEELRKYRKSLFFVIVYKNLTGFSLIRNPARCKDFRCFINISAIQCYLIYSALCI